MDCIVYGVAKNWTQLSEFHCHFSYMSTLMSNYRGPFRAENSLEKRKRDLGEF